MKRGKRVKPSGITRRAFMGAAAAATAFTIVPRHVLGGPGYTSPSDRINIAGVGAGGHGAFLFDGIVNENKDVVNLVALCDVDEKHASASIQRPIPRVVNIGAYKAFPEARQYKDFRKMLDKEEKAIDAVVVCTPDHTHIPISVMAMKMGKHVYCEKPLGHNVHEVRVATEVARKQGVVTQTGIGNHASETFRRVVEIIRSGGIGEVREAYVWCDNEWEEAPRRVSGYNIAEYDYRPPAMPVPAHLDWDLWLGPAPVRPYNRWYHPLHWRGWWDFANGRLGDIGCHTIDLVFWALDLKYPLTVEAKGPGRPAKERLPPWLTARWTFPARGSLPPVTLHWYDGNKRPERFKDMDLPHDWPVAVLFIGSEGMLITQIEIVPPRFELHPKEKFADYTPPPRTIPRTIGHYREWIRACKSGGGTGTTTSFDYTGPLTETVLLGTVAYRVGKKLDWDAENLKAKDCPEADQYIRREYRKGWSL